MPLDCLLGTDRTEKSLSPQRNKPSPNGLAQLEVHTSPIFLQSHILFIGLSRSDKARSVSAKIIKNVFLGGC